MFLETHFRDRTPVFGDGNVPSDFRDTVLQSFLARLLERPLPEREVPNPRGYFTTIYRRHGLDLIRKRQRREAKVEGGIQDVLPNPCSSDAAQEAHARERLRRVEQAMRQLPIADRVVLKVSEAPRWLTSEENAWLAARASLSVDELQSRLSGAVTRYEVTLVFDPGDTKEDATSRRKRMERFRRRQARARGKLRSLLQESGDE